MILKNKKLLIITSLLTLLPIPVGLLLWNRFPETMAIHWGFSGEADSFASIPTAVFLPPLLRINDGKRVLLLEFLTVLFGYFFTFVLLSTSTFIFNDPSIFDPNYPNLCLQGTI